MKNWTIRQRILGSFALILLLMAVQGALALASLGSINEDVVALDRDSAPGVYYSQQLEAAWLENLVLTQHLVWESKAEEESFHTKLLANQRRLDELAAQYETTIFTTRDRALFEAFKKLREPYARIQSDILKLSDGAKNREAQALLRHELGPAFEKTRSAIQAIVALNKTNSDRAESTIMADIVRTRMVIITGMVVTLLAAFICGYFLLQAIAQPLGRLLGVLDVMRQGDFTARMQLARRDEFGSVADGFDRMSDELAALVGQVQKSGMQVTTSVTEVAATAREQQATASEIAATTLQIGATSREIFATARELVKTMGEVSQVAEHSAMLAGSGQTGLSHMEETMHQVMAAAGSINAKLAVLNEKAGNINQVVTTITKVADQTNLLSLNAAIEAEKAGEYGRGFSVVAIEIRRLADQTAVATYDIEQMVKEIQSAVSASVMGMDKFAEETRRGMQEVQHIGSQLSQIIQQVQALAPRFETVNEGMQAQATGAEQITEALGQLSEAAQQTVESLRQSSTAIDDLNQVANLLLGGISRFKLQA
ncbi:methyl-accepting chemotaxis protein [Pseudogulbenkiania sp. MAI-1]|uniref:methyl-accepting chemotaxis protein n=1 Tax=Pseudogulbenkiania sp. MAI-1 TaxID=990370 RepID=UPI00045E9E90|nr:methyl-accepting chemotaxis protein [Pseudogulbenkiania sp. MAI-1]